MKVNRLLTLLLFLLLPLAGIEQIAVVGDASVGCDDSDYALSNPGNCGTAVESPVPEPVQVLAPNPAPSPSLEPVPVGCSDSDYAFLHPAECGTFIEPPAPAPVGCSDVDYALLHPVECGTPVGCSDNDYALTHPAECGTLIVPSPCEDVSYSLTHTSECGVPVTPPTPGSCVDVDYALLHPVECGTPVGCSDNDYALLHPTECGTIVPPGPGGPTPEQPPSDGGSSGGAVDNPPSVAINVPSSAAPGSQLSVSVTGTDDFDVAQLLFYDANGVQLATSDCPGVQTSCSVIFSVTAPSTFTTTYAFKTRSKDSANQFSSFVSGSGSTTAAPAPLPNPTPSPVIVPPKVSVSGTSASESLSIEFPTQKLFIRSGAFQASDCLKPGESAWFVAQVENKGAIQKDVRFATIVTDLSIYSSDGPTVLSAHDSSAHWFNIEVPETAKSGMYYLQLEIGNNDFKRIMYRSFFVGSNC